MARPRCKFVGLTRDWVALRLPMTWDVAPDWFASAIGGAVEPFTPGANKGYRGGYRAEEKVNTGAVSIMGDNPACLGWSLFEATGGAAEWGWNIAAQQFDVVQANRIDAALDFMTSERSFDRMLREAEGICKAMDRPMNFMGTKDKGRTFYFNWSAKTGLDDSGNAKVGYYTGRLYEKGKQLGLDPEYGRFEVSVHPDKGAKKERAFRLEPAEIIGSPNWSRALLDVIGYSDAVKPARASPFARETPVSVDAKVAKRMSALSHMGEQYGEAVRDLVKLVGEDEARRLVELALFRPVIVQPDGRETTGPGLLRREAQQRYADVFRDDLQRRMHDAGDGGKLYH